VIAVLGPGGVGGFVAAALERAGQPVILVARSSTARALGESGLHVTSRALDATFTAHPQTADEIDRPFDALLVATKASGLEDALTRVAPTGPGIVVPLLNGLDHMGVLRARFGDDRVRAGVIRVQSDRPRPGEIVQDSAAVRIDIAGPEDVHAGPLAHALRRAGIDVRTGAPEAEVLWAKLCRLNPIACATTAFAATLGEIRDDPSRLSALHAAIAETCAVARAEGAAIDADATRAEVDALLPGQSSSMARDVAQGAEPELDAIAGAVVRAARRHDIATPAVSYLVERIEARLRQR
jgi:2-dehydropantoate 2-reductase